MELTKHAQKRNQQRGISPTTLEILLDYGHTRKSHGGTEIVFLTKRDKKYLAGEMESSGACSRMRNNYLVVGRHGKIITSGHRNKRVKYL